MTTLDDLETAKNKFDEAKTKYLTERGWKRTSNNPACIWLWEKALPDGRTVLANQETALFFEGMSA